MNIWSEWKRPRSGWSRRTKLVAFGVGMVLALSWGIAWQYAESRAAERPGQVAQRCVPPGGGDQSCRSWAQKQARKFTRDKLGNSQGVHGALMSKAKWNRLMTDAVKRYKKRHPGQFRTTGTARDSWGDWCQVCDYFFEAERCMATGLHPAGCAEAKEDAAEIQRIGKKVSWFTLTCGGGAVIGGGATRNPAGAIFGGILACGWGKAADLAKPENCVPGRIAGKRPTCPNASGRDVG